jgi:adenosylmethionine-8-amino-7-oxononanoate aminotransferase
MPNPSQNNFTERDKKVIWHPFTQHHIEPNSIAITRGEGAYLYDEDGNKYIDAIASWWVNLHGHSNTYMAEKVYEQALKLEQVIFAGFTHEPAIRLAERLLSHLPSNFQKVFYSDNGSTAVEVGVKMALQFFHNQGQIKRRKIIALTDAYHGDTFGAMSLGAPSAFNAPFQDMLFEVEFIPNPNQALECLNDLETKLKDSDEYAAIIFEPLIQGAGGMNMYPAETLDQIISMAKKHGLLCISDEIMTGFGRTGKWFAMDYLQQKPDILCLSKGLTGGMMAMGVTVCSDPLFESFLSSDRKKTLFHSHSFTANPLACAAANASLDLMEKTETWSQIAAIQESHAAWKNKLQNHPVIRNIRCWGTIVACEIDTPEKDGYLNPIRGKAYDHFIKKGILLRPLGNTLYILPPYCIKPSELAKIYLEIENFAATIS